MTLEHFKKTISDLKYISCFFNDGILRANILVIKGCRDQFGSAGTTEVSKHGECEEPKTGPHRSQSRVLVKQRYPSWHLDRRCLRRYPCLHLAQIRYTVSTVSHSQNIHGFAKQ